jgi:hypothetical protein
MAATVATFKSMTYDHPAYTSRAPSWTSIMTAGNAGVSGKFVAHANLVLYGLSVYTTIAGTSTYTGGLFGQPPLATLAVASTQLNIIRITNTAAAGATIGLSTSTVGPYTVGGVFNGAGNTATNQVGAAMYFPVNTASAVGGLAINAGDQIYVVNGTDATAVELVSFDFAIAPGASVIA